MALSQRFLFLVLVVGLSQLDGATLPAGFTETQFGSTLNASPTAMAFAPDGRLFVCQQNGQLRIIKNGGLLATPFVTLSVNSSGEFMMSSEPVLAPGQYQRTCVRSDWNQCPDSRVHCRE
jgi:hypothetical protein